MSERAALYVDVTLRGVRGGFDAFGYLVTLRAEEDTRARAVQGSRFEFSATVALRPDEVQTVTVELPALGRRYAPCFDVSVRDAAGHTIAAPPLCLEQIDVEAEIAESSEPADSEDTEQPSDVADGGGTGRSATRDAGPDPADREADADSASCAIRDTRDRRTGWYAAIALLGLTLALGRRRAVAAERT